MSGLKLEIGNWRRTRAWVRIFSSQFLISSFHFRRSKNACSGVALMGVIIMIVLMGLLGGGVLMLITTSSMESLQTLQWSKAFFAAETGISRAKAAWYGSLPWTNTGLIGSASFEIVITTNAENKVVVSSTSVQGYSRWTSRWRPAEILRAIIVYKEGSEPEPRYRTYSNRGLSTEFTNNSVVDPTQWQRIEASPRTNEFLLVTQNDQRRIYAQTYLNGAWVSNTYLNNAGRVPDAARRGFDVAYESLSGRGMVVYSINTANPQYRVWTSTGWSSPPGSINVGATNPISWIRLISKPGTDEIMCLARWQRTASAKYSSAIIWNGTTWTNLIPLERECASTITYETLDAAYSANTGLVVYINGSTLAQRRIPKYRTYTNGVWGIEKTMEPGSVGANPSWIRVEYSADGAQAYACIMQASRYFYGTYWNGSAWGSYNTFSNARLEIVSRRCFDIAWSSQTNTLMVAYSLNQNAQSYLLATGGGSSNRYGNMVSTDDGQWCVLKPDPFTSNFYYLAIDGPQGRNVNFQRWTGSAWTNYPKLENSSDNNYLSIDFSFRKDSASTNCW